MEGKEERKERGWPRQGKSRQACTQELAAERKSAREVLSHQRLDLEAAGHQEPSPSYWLGTACSSLVDKSICASVETPHPARQPKTAEPGPYRTGQGYLMHSTHLTACAHTPPSLLPRDGHIQTGGKVQQRSWERAQRMAPFSLSSQGGCSRELPSKRPHGCSNLRAQEE